ncbi:MAG: S1 RNA-binding domain-containing protein [Acutalibacteraceae bacterium]|nr:S1 RNA-binding domain-containing protein [Acutalibacteraceae bacterium]
MKEFYPEGTRANKGVYTQSFLEQAVISGEILEGMVLICDEEHNLTVELGSMKGVIKREEGAVGISEGQVRDIALITRVGKSVCFLVTGFEYDSQGVKYAVLSRRKAQERYRQYIKESMSAGDVIEAKVTHFESFGAFCDIGCGVVALLPIDCISVSRIFHPKDRLSINQTIKAVVKNIGEDLKITLSHKELLGSWEENAALFSPHLTVSGVVRSVEAYGIFVELTPNLAGLAEYFEGVQVGDTVSVYIKSIIPEKMKVKLIIIDKCEEDYTPETHYFYEGEHIDLFRYSPLLCSRNIFTDFKEGD